MIQFTLLKYYTGCFMENELQASECNATGSHDSCWIEDSLGCLAGGTGIVDGI